LRHQRRPIQANGWFLHKYLIRESFIKWYLDHLWDEPFQFPHVRSVLLLGFVNVYRFGWLVDSYGVVGEFLVDARRAADNGSLKVEIRGDITQSSSAIGQLPGISLHRRSHSSNKERSHDPV
jgi:hypothetical protein